MVARFIADGHGPVTRSGYGRPDALLAARGRVLESIGIHPEADGSVKRVQCGVCSNQHPASKLLAIYCSHLAFGLQHRPSTLPSPPPSSARLLVCSPSVSPSPPPPRLLQLVHCCIVLPESWCGRRMHPESVCKVHRSHDDTRSHPPASGVDTALNRHSAPPGLAASTPSPALCEACLRRLASVSETAPAFRPAPAKHETRRLHLASSQTGCLSTTPASSRLQDQPRRLSATNPRPSITPTSSPPPARDAGLAPEHT